MTSVLLSLAITAAPAQASPSTADGCNLSEMGAMTFFQCLVNHNDSVEANGSAVEDLLGRMEALEALVGTQASTIATLEGQLDACLVEADLAALPASAFPGTLATTAELDDVWAALDDLPDGGTTVGTPDGEVDLTCIETRLENLEAVNDEASAECLVGDSDDDGQLDDLDCAPDDPTRQSYLFYPDVDNDGYGALTPTYGCSTSADLPPLGFVDNNQDCFDGNEDVFPDQTEWFSSPRGDGSYDYDCSGTDERRWNSVYVVDPTTCALLEEGWTSSPIPSCGSVRDWVVDVELEFDAVSGFACEAVTETRMQECQ